VEMTITFKGLSDVEAGLRELPAQLEKDVLREGLKSAGEAYRDGMATRVPERTGTLLTSLTYKVEVTPTPRVLIGPGREGFYGSFVELGTRFMSPRPFMRPTMYQDAEIALSAFVNGCNRVFNRLVSRAKRLA
jgi:HK97 gp10 family phage protein